MQFSGAFMTHLQHIENWRMDNEFFLAFPELYDDITPTETIPPSISCTPSQRIIDERRIPAANSATEAQVSEDALGLAQSTFGFARMGSDIWNETALGLTSSTVTGWP